MSHRSTNVKTSQTEYSNNTADKGSDDASDRMDVDDEDESSYYVLDIQSHFKLPVYYLEKKNELKKEIVDDLELVDVVDASCVPVYSSTFDPKTDAGKIVLREFPKYYTTDTAYLEDTQRLLKSISVDDEKPCEPLESVMRIWQEVKGDMGFKNKYHYIDWSYWEKYNQSESVLQFISMYSLASPFLSLLVPLIIVIIPFFIIKARGLDVNMTEYIQVLKVVAANHALCRLFTNFTSVSFDQKIYLLFSTALYVFSIYQNFLTCLRFYNNMKKIHKELTGIRDYINDTVTEMDKFLVCSKDLASYNRFNDTIRENRDQLIEFNASLTNIQGVELNYRNLGQIGKLMKYFYQIYADDKCNAMFLYSFGFHGFVENIRGLVSNIQAKRIGFSTFRAKKKTVFKKAYYGAHIHTSRTTNDIKLDKSMIITGPNASGKTTTLKTTLINVLITQQFGCGYYKSANMTPFHHIHCYLNIPDTSGRDSLFQAEARRCKEIIDVIKQNTKDHHFCVFDELYSGTNPDEAVLSATAFMNYLVGNKKVKCILTTHFVSVCRRLDDHKEIVNYKMDTKKDGDGFKYTYSLRPGISEVRGGLKVLSDMQYPKEILDNSISIAQESSAV